MDYTPTDTDVALAEMLTENTGTHMLDSGGAYGRNWERNAGGTAEGFYNAPDVIVSEYDGKFEGVTLDLFHWLRERVDIDQDGTDDFNLFAETEAQASEGWMQVCEAYVDHLRDKGHEVAGFWGEGDPDWVNTYNGEDALSQVIQYMTLEIDDEPKALIQIHGGCDVRGGYTAPRMFDTDQDQALYDNACLVAVTHHPDQEGGGLIELERIEPIWWDSDNGGYSWSVDGNWATDDTDGPEWKMVEGQVIYEPWGTTVGFMAR